MTTNKELQAALVQKTGREYRWENRAVGQGHYFTDLGDCLDDARDYSRKWPDATLLIEEFRPLRAPLLLVKNGVIEHISRIKGAKTVTRKDHELIAKVIKGLRGEVKNTQCRVKRLVCENFVSALQEANANFNADKFRKACEL